ncbi:MAG TPA: metallophosphoesterase [Ktedonobacterales bacterium]
MTRVVVASDLHLGITRRETLENLATAIAAERPDLTVLAGDIGEGHSRFRSCLEIFLGLPGDTAVLAGNHDVWACEGLSSVELWERALAAAARAAGMLWLEDEVWVKEGLGVAGSIAWYDYSAAAPGLNRSAAFWAANKGRYNLDARLVNWPWPDQEFAARVGDGLVERVMRLEEDASVQAILVVTHVPLYEEQMERRPHDLNWTIGNAYFGNLTLGARLEAARKLHGVISGHTHVSRQGWHPRPDGESPQVWVIDSDYGKPRSVTFDYPEPGEAGDANPMG